MHKYLFSLHLLDVFLAYQLQRRERLGNMFISSELREEDVPNHSLPVMCFYLCIFTSEIHAITVAVLTRVIGEVARVTSCYSPQHKYTLPGRRGTSTEACNSIALCAGNALDRITYMLPYCAIRSLQTVAIRETSGKENFDNYPSDVG